LAEVMMAGDAKGRVFTFPIPTYNITKNIDWDSPVLDKVFEMTAKYGVPYFSNFINSDMDPDDARSMCCRLRLDNRELRKRGGGLFGANPLTGSIGVVTLNLPRIGYLAKNKEEFYQRLEKMMDLAKESLEIKRKFVESFTDQGLFPYCKFYLSSIKEGFDSYWKNHFNTIGLIGMNEACLNLIGQDITTPEGGSFAAGGLDFMRNRLMDYQEETGSLYNLEATPGEGTAYRLAKIDKEKYPTIIVANQKACQESGKAPYYTNSSQLPVGYTDDMFSALDIQDGLQTRYTGGTVFHGFIGESLPSVASTKSLVRKIAENYSLPYYTITPTFSICPNHGYLSGEHFFCPKCDEAVGYKSEQPAGELANLEVKQTESVKQ
ncbi:MAG TPA: ribonucleoside triphosphate reductase, partial [Patescibacteria group bacterium]